MRVWAESSTAPFWPNLCLDPLVCVDTLELFIFLCLCIYLCVFCCLMALFCVLISFSWFTSTPNYLRNFFHVSNCLLPPPCISEPSSLSLLHLLFSFFEAGEHLLHVFCFLMLKLVFSGRRLAVYDWLPCMTCSPWKVFWDLLWGLSFLIHIKEMETSFASEPASQLIK